MMPLKMAGNSNYTQSFRIGVHNTIFTAQRWGWKFSRTNLATEANVGKRAKAASEGKVGLAAGVNHEANAGHRATLPCEAGAR